jgi:ATP-binding cassette subfamily F protein uup
MPLITLDRVSIAYGHLPLLDSIFMQVETGERVSVIGRNGMGKSSLLRVINGEQAPDSGRVGRQSRGSSRTQCYRQTARFLTSWPRG